MISESYIMELLEKWSKTPSGRKIIAEFRKQYYKGNIVGNDKDGAMMSRSKMISIGDEMKAILYRHIVSVIPSFKIEDIVVRDPKEMANGDYSIQIFFNASALHRDSLFTKTPDGMPTKFSEGLDNIIMLFTYGYNAKNQVHGYWHNKWIGSKIERESNSFLKDAIEDFNSNDYKNIVVTLDEQYNK